MLFIITQTNGFPILIPKNINIHTMDIKHSDSNDSDNYEHNHVKIVQLENNYTLNSTIIQTRINFNPITYLFTGNIIVKFNTTFNNYDYCKINIDIPNQYNDNVIRNFIYINFDISTNINIICNKEHCVHHIYYNKSSNYEEFKCLNLNTKQLNDEF